MNDSIGRREGRHASDDDEGPDVSQDLPPQEHE